MTKKLVLLKQSSLMPTLTGCQMPLKLNPGLKLTPLILLLKQKTPPSPRSVSSEVTLLPSLRTAPPPKKVIAMKLTTLAYPAGLSVSSGPLPQHPLLDSDKPPKTTSTLLSSQTERSLPKSPGLMGTTRSSQATLMSTRSARTPLLPMTS